MRDSLNAWAGCVAGAMDVDDFTAALEAAGFVDVQVQASYWDETQINAAVEQVDPRITSYNVCYTKLLRILLAPNFQATQELSHPRRFALKHAQAVAGT